MICTEMYGNGPSDLYSTHPASHIWAEDGTEVVDGDIPVEDANNPDAISDNGIVTLISVNPYGPESGTSHVIRGGDFSSFPRYLRCAERHSPTGDEHIGFRLLRRAP